MPQEIKYPEIRVRLIGEDGNAFAVMGAIKRALQRAGVPKDQVAAFFTEAVAGDYDHLLRVAQRWITVL